MTIEQRLLKDYGTTGTPEFATWMLSDGTLVNGTYEGRQRDVDHRCVGEYFSRSKREIPGSSVIYVRKFMRRGNVRVCCSEWGSYFEFDASMSESQIRNVLRHVLDAGEIGRPAGVGRHRGPVTSMSRVSQMSVPEFIQYLERYVFHGLDRIYAMDGRAYEYI